ncbi:MAG: DUF5024 domain-containing protein [Candidatus Azobacteroides sp.]|nr:DUF5024 domain-containing protein [Candidatus Azobacteroides sp.]
MKRNVEIMALLFLMSSFLMKLVAQENLDALVKKCEMMEGVYAEVIYTKNEQTKKFEPTITNISIENNPTLINEFLAALKKDEEKAFNKTETRVKGRTYSFFYRFDNANYTFYYNEKGECSGIKILLTPQK